MLPTSAAITPDKSPYTEEFNCRPDRQIGVNRNDPRVDVQGRHTEASNRRNRAEVSGNRLFRVAAVVSVLCPQRLQLRDECVFSLNVVGIFHARLYAGGAFVR
jgi:hypothetical protein